MYHHRYQPQPSHLATRNSNAFGSLNQQQQHRQSAHASSTGPNQQRASNQQPATEFGPGKSYRDEQIAPASNNHSSRYQHRHHHHNNNNNNPAGGSGHHYKQTANSVYHSGAYASQPKQFAEERQDVIFRRVRGILNKITPETFDKLSKELINVGLDSPRTLRGLIYLLFDKALKDLKYSSLYAKLCQQLSEKSPNFETEPGPNTFCKFLISKCEDEFERRRKATEDFDAKNELTDEEFEQKVIAKQKMLGNIKFICELGKKRLLQEEILHECIRGLLSKKKERPIQDMAQDLECLCQIMRTIGSLLDIDASRNLMNQYFERIDMYSRKPELPSRIRFMLRDVIDLRNNKWRPRPYQREDNVPQPLSRLREEAGFNSPAGSVSIDKIGNTKNLLNIGNLTKMHGGKLSSLLLEDDGPSFTTTTDFHWGSNTFMPDETEFDIFSTTVPVQKIDTSSQRMTSASSITRTNNTQSTHSTNLASVSAHPASTNQFTGLPAHVSQSRSMGSFGDKNGLSGIHNKSDPFTDTLRGARLNYNERQPPFKENNFGPRGNQAINRSVSGHQPTFDRRAMVEEPPLLAARVTSPNFIKMHDFDQTISRRDIEVHKDRPINNNNNNTLHNNILPAERRQVHARDEFAGLLDMGRDEHVLLEKLNSQMHRPTVDRNRDEINHVRPNRSLDKSETRADQRRFANGGSGPRDRRLDGGNERVFEREPRQPKFSGANYRLPGRDRPLQNQPPRDQFLADREPESDLNLNWRSKEPAARKDLASDIGLGPDSSVHKLAEKLNSDAPARHVRQDSRSVENARQKVEPGLMHLQEVAVNNSHNHPDDLVSRFRKPQQPIDFIANKEPSRQDRRLSPGNMEVENFNKLSEQAPRPEHEVLAPRYLNEEPKQVQSNRLSRRSNNIQEQGHHTQDYSNNRNNGPPPRLQQNLGNSGDRRERDRNNQRFPPIGATTTLDERKPLPSARLNEERDERGFQRPGFGRPQPFDGHRQPDVVRAKDWRKEGNFQTIKKDQVPTAPTTTSGPVLKTPTRMSETDFTLRPSHNLVGRTFGDANLQQTDKSDAAKSSNRTEMGRPEPTAKIEVNHTGTRIASLATATDECNSPVSESSSKDMIKDLHVNKFMSLVKQTCGVIPMDTSKVASKVKELKIHKNFHQDCLLSIMKQSIIGTDTDRENNSKVLASLVPSIFETSSLLTASKTMFEQMQTLEAETPKVKSLVAEFLSRSVSDSLLNIEDVADLLNGGKHHPLFLLLLQKLEKSCGKTWLVDKFLASKISLIDMLPEVDRSKDRLASALKDRCLSFLDPMLTIEPDLWQQMKENDPSPTAVYRWIKENVDQTIQSAPTFAHVFVACLLRYIHGKTSEKFKGNVSQSDSDDSNKSSPSNSSSSQAVNEFEKELLSKYEQVLQALLKDKPMQLATLYAVQAFYHGLDFPKGALLRWFHMLYDMSIVDDDVFFIWKEEINNEFPGKGQALFQVNTWLNWLAEAESEDDEET